MNAPMLAYLLGCEIDSMIVESLVPAQNKTLTTWKHTALVRKQLRNFWAKKDLNAMLHFITNNIKIWKFAIPLILNSHVAHRWFYQERDFNKVDLIYRI